MNGFDFAIQMLRNGYRVTRKGWPDGSVVWLDGRGKSDGDKNAVLKIKSGKAEGKWNALQDDLLAEDWDLVY